ncbi:choice-of-anchor D domain-containing protein [Chiayiivirga flava]|uniref:HYDIN/VesB/CFA65-like Ig-like domain-containing protein n=1 Tax=Chiayiivirga flava TaxID=659595 RepID=A0A7W8G0M0_9GAMM|nr:choice-of-anchor D domain-containing protein [Chiayiivirga flava]MBB5209331.1 hypothetical protein [Chiayiivirga flava]
MARRTIRGHGAAGVVLALVACGALAGETCDFAFEPASLDLGGVVYGQSATGTVLLRSTGTDALVVDLVELRWGEPSMTLTHDGCSGITLAADATCSIDVTFTPTALGERGERLGAQTNTNVSDPLLEIAAEGLPVDAPALSVTPGSIAFGPTVVGQTTATRDVFVVNVGNTALNVSDAVLQGPGAHHFLLTAPDACNADGPLAPGASCEINVRFEPGAVGSFGASVRLTSDAPGSPHVVPLSGTGLATDQTGVAADATALDFGTVFTGQSTSMTLTYSNIGSQVLSIDGYTIGGPDADAFLVTADSCSGHMGVGADCVIALRFSPTQVRAYVAQVQIDTPAETLPPPVVLTGDGEALTMDIFTDGFDP